MEKKVEELIELLSDYHGTKSNGIGREITIDRLIDVFEDLEAGKDGNEGYMNEELTMLVKEGDPLPQPFTTRRLESPLTKKVYEINIRLITGLRVNEDKDLIVTFLGNRKVVGDMTEFVGDFDV